MIFFGGGGEKFGQVWSYVYLDFPRKSISFATEAQHVLCCHWVKLGAMIMTNSLAFIQSALTGMSIISSMPSTIKSLEPVASSWSLQRKMKNHERRKMKKNRTTKNEKWNQQQHLQPSFEIL